MAVAEGQPAAPVEIGNEIQAELRSLAQATKSDIDVRRFVAEYIRIVMRFLPVRVMRVWQGSDVDQLVEMGHASRSADGASAQFSELPNRDVMTAVLITKTAKIYSASITESDTGARPSSDASTSWIFVPIAGTIAVHGLAFCELLPEATESATICANRLQAITEIAVPYFDIQFTRELMRERATDRRFQEFCRDIHAEPSLATTSATVATEYLRFFQPDRTWVVLKAGSGWRVRAVGGIPGFQRRAEVVRKLERLVALVARTREPFEWSVGEIPKSLSPRFRAALDGYLDETHVSELRIEPLVPTRAADDAATSRDAAIGFVVCEWFQPSQSPMGESRWRTARQQAALALQNASDWSHAPVAQMFRRWRRTTTWNLVGGWGLVVASVAVAATIGAMIPVEYTVDATGEMLPVRRRHVFATSPGIVRSLNVNSGATVSEGQTLLQLDSPELELEIRRTEGELQTTEKRIAAIEASRLDFGTTSSDSVSQINSLAGELKELRQKRENFGRELETLNQRRDELQVISPIRGRVVTWDLERTLSRRPVARGQRLVTISDSDGPWELELRVRDDDTGDLFAAMKRNQAVPIDFVVVTLPETVYATTLKTISETVEIRSPGDDPTLLCRADVPEELKQSAVEGMSVRGRIHCGRRPIIVVAFTKLWRIIREQVLFPWGW